MAAMTSAEVMIQRLRKSRQRDVTIGRFTFTVEKPADMRLFGLLAETPPTTENRAYQDLMDSGRLAISSIVGWKGVRGVDLMSGDTEDEIPFNAELCRAWLEDRSDLWDAISTTIWELREAHRQTLEADAKN